MVYDAEADGFLDSRWNDNDQQHRREIQQEQDEVERRMTAGGWYDGKQELLPDVFEEDYKGEFEYDGDNDVDDDVFHDAFDEEVGTGSADTGSAKQYDIAATTSSRPSIVRSGSMPSRVMSMSTDGATDDFQSCRESLNESIFGSENMDYEACTVERDDSISIGRYGQHVQSQSLPSSPIAEALSIGTQEDVEDDLAEDVFSAENVKELSMGEHLKDVNVFALERLSNRTVTGIMLMYYFVFLALFVYGLIFVFRETEQTYQMAIVPSGSNSGDDYICFPRANVNASSSLAATEEESLPCEPSPSITINQANLLANTVVVSDGLDVSNWRGNGALPGTPPFEAQNITTLSSFIIDGEALDYEANPELHTQWQNISAAIWLGVSGSNEATRTGITSAKLKLQFGRTDGLSWPRDTPDYVVLVAAHLYACLRGANCSSVGEYRSQLLQAPMGPSYGISPERSLSESGSIYSIVFNLPNSLLGSDTIQALAWRFVLHGDPNGVVSSCLAGENCVVTAVMENTWTNNAVQAIVDATLLVCYFCFFMWWITTLALCSGWPWKWAVEQRWLLILGVALSCYNNIYSVYLSIVHSYSNDYSFNQYDWFASYCFRQVCLLASIS